MKYAVVEDGMAIHGIGSSEADAIADAREWGTDPDLLEDLPLRPAAIGDLYVTRCTDALAKAVAKNGGDILFRQRADGVVCLPDEDR